MDIDTRAAKRARLESDDEDEESEEQKLATCAAIKRVRDEAFQSWVDVEGYADRMIPLIGTMYRQHNLLFTMFGKTMVHVSPVDIIKVHYASVRNFAVEISVHDSFLIISAFNRIENMAPMRIDVGRTTILLRDTLNALHKEKRPDDEIIAKLAEDLRPQVEAVAVRCPNDLMSEGRDVVLYGFGRIGRLVARVLVEKTGSGSKLLLRAVVVRSKGSPEADLIKRASLLRWDSIHGEFGGTISVDLERSSLVVNGNYIRFMYCNSPDEADYEAVGVKNAILVDNTGIWRDRASLGRHLARPGISDVVLTAPAKGDVPNVVAGVNSEAITPDEHIYSCASCTTNAIAPVLKVIQSQFGIESGHVETIHSFTNDQNLTDNFHSKSRRGRSAVLNMVLTETGAAKAVEKAIPSLKGVLTANAIRVPTPNVSMAILMLNVQRDVTLEDINGEIRHCALQTDLMNQIEYSYNDEAVSSDFIGSRAAAIVDAHATVVRRRQVNLYVWYDNEYGYTCQVIRCVQRMAGIVHPVFPPTQNVQPPALMQEGGVELSPRRMA